MLGSVVRCCLCFVICRALFVIVVCCLLFVRVLFVAVRCLLQFDACGLLCWLLLFVVCCLMFAV